MHNDRFSTIARVIRTKFLTLSLLIVVTATANGQGTQESTSNTGSVTGSVIIVETGGPSFVPGATVKLSGSTEFEAQTDNEGKFKFATVLPGTYSITGQFPSLEAKPATVVVEPGK